MSRIAIIGLGSPFGDDRAGWEVVQALTNGQWSRNVTRNRIRVECLDRPGPRLLERFREADCVILIDAMRSGAPAGTVRQLGPDEIAAASATHSSHGFGLAQTIALARALGSLPPELVLFGIEADSFGGTGLSPRVEAAIPSLVARIDGHVKGLTLEDFPAKAVRRAKG